MVATASETPTLSELLARAEFPEICEFLFEPHRYKVLHGGRGGAKSWTIARALLILGIQTPLRILCARETQKSIQESVHLLLEDQIRELGLQAFYRVEKARIIGPGGTEFTFAGLRHNINNIKSLESYDIVWVEEAQTVSKGSWEKLIPTLRKAGSEIWVSFNPELEADDTYQRFIVHPPKSAKVVEINWRDNPWFPPVLREEMETLKEQSVDDYNHVYEGRCVSMLAGAIFAQELRAVDLTNRITSVPYDPTQPVHCFWDLGYGDLTTCWMVQMFPFQYRLIDYLEGKARPMHWYIKELQTRGYVFGTDYLPWDLGAHTKELGSGKSIEELMRAAGRKVAITPRMPVVDRLNAARTIFPLCFFDRERCADGLHALRHYRYGEIESLNGHPTREPLHDWASHAADAFGYFALKANPPKEKKQKPKGPQQKPPSVWS